MDNYKLLDSYFKEHKHPSAFLISILSGELFEAFNRRITSGATLEQMRDLVFYIPAHAPAGSYGSKGKVLRWLRSRP